MNDICKTDSGKLRRLADGLKQDARALWDAGNKTEGMRLFRLFRKIARELHRREKERRHRDWCLRYSGFSRPWWNSVDVDNVDDSKAREKSS